MQYHQLQQQLQQQQQKQQINPLAVLQKIKEELNSKGAKIIRSLGKSLREMSSYDGNKKLLDRNDFLADLKQYGIQFNNNEAIALLTYLDKDGDGSVDLNEFLINIRGELNKRRQAMTDKVFLKFDKDGLGYISVAEIKNNFNSSFHPKVQQGQMTEEQILAEFLTNFSDVDKDGTINRKEWNDYYAAVSASIDNDDHFVELMKIAWKLE